MKLDQKYPSIPHLENRAEARIPKFAFEYLAGGIGSEVCLRENQEALQSVKLIPRYISEAGKPDLSRTLFGHRYDQPFGVAPIGLSGLMWPRTAEILASAAKRNNVPFVLSCFANASLERISEIAGHHAWFQLYLPKEAEVLADLMHRAKDVGYSVLVLTIDSPTAPRRQREIRNGLSMPPTLGLCKLMQILQHPSWATSMLLTGIPTFATLERYVPRNSSIGETAAFFGNMIEGHVPLQQLKKIRDSWDGILLVKGILHPEDAKQCLSVGVDGLIVSNHGGRQIDAAPASVEVVGRIRKSVGPEIVIIADGGVRSGLDVARMIASGANFVLLGRPFVFAVAALGAKGGEHVMHILNEEFRTTMAQLGCSRTELLPDFLSP